MIYFDYAATTPVDEAVAESYARAQQQVFANPDSLHGAGTKAANLIKDAKKQMASLLAIQPTELIITSGATEANNLALFGAARAFKQRGNHIITTNIEHASVSKTLDALAEEGFEITKLPVNTQGIIEEAILMQAIRPTTILISIMHINNEIGSILPVNQLARSVKQQFPQILFHSDMAQSIGKSQIDLQAIDLATFSGHKFYAPKTIGLLYKKNNLMLTPLLYGGQQEGGLRPGTVNAALVAATAKAMRLAFERLNNQAIQAEVMEKRNIIVEQILKQNEDVMITLDHQDFTQLTPYIIHFQIKNSKVQIETYLNALSNVGICLSTRSTCHTKFLHEANPVLQALGISADESRRGMRISISHRTTMAEITAFAAKFNQILTELKL